MGENGSGKTSGSGQTIAKKYLRTGFGGLVLCYDTDEPELWGRYLAETGRSDDALFFSADRDLRFNFLDHEGQSSGMDYVENLVSLLVDIASVQKSAETSSNEKEFWLPQKQKLLRNGISLLLLANEPIRMRDIYEMIVTSPVSLDQTRDQEWQKASYLFKLFNKAYRARSHPEWQLIENYWMYERPTMDNRTRSNIDTDFTGMFDPLTRGRICGPAYLPFFCSPTTVKCF